MKKLKFTFSNIIISLKNRNRPLSNQSLLLLSFFNKFDTPMLFIITLEQVKKSMNQFRFEIVITANVSMFLHP